MDQAGIMPLPPYIHEELKDKNRYQTVYARHSGSAAAPTAGLHFTPELLKRLKEKGVNFAKVTLHVGLGTFRPVKVENIQEHIMHKEKFEVSREAAEVINEAKRSGKRIIAVGTTSLRTLESISDDNGMIYAGSGETGIFIYPGYRFKVVDALITNFHHQINLIDAGKRYEAGRRFTDVSGGHRPRYRFSASAMPVHHRLD